MNEKIKSMPMNQFYVICTKSNKRKIKMVLHRGHHSGTPFKYLAGTSTIPMYWAN
jgi:hypothetical protein